ncbi:site-specific integrase [Thermopolyspora sp. NPDC052614]|uniref:tyrosine-type recombinase/integrase n=1 Tax=Thermopolyspora sp. NPDC052614 TaxID=3155682 RepID=UPI0034347368
MKTSYDVKFFETYRNKSSKAPSYVVRWQVAGKRSSKTYRTKALAESFLSDLRQAAKRGEPFDVESGLPASKLKAKSARTVFDFVRAYIDMKWPHAAAKTRDSISDALSTVLPALTKDRPGRPDAETLQTALRKCALIPADKRPEPSPEMARAIRWLEGASLDLADLNETKTVRLALDALALRLDGQAASANTARRKRAVLHAVLEYAVELEELPSNPLHKVKWKPPKTTETVDPRVVVNPRQAKELLTAVTYVGKRGRGRRLMALFACMYYAALRPAEAVALRRQDCHLPATGWGRLLVDVSRPEVNTQWTDSGDAHEERGLKHRGRDDVRPVPIPPALVKILRQHIEEFGVGSDGRIFRSERGGVIASTAYTEV